MMSGGAHQGAKVYFESPSAERNQVWGKITSFLDKYEYGLHQPPQDLEHIKSEHQQQSSRFAWQQFRPTDSPFGMVLVPEDPKLKKATTGKVDTSGTYEGNPSSTVPFKRVTWVGCKLCISNLASKTQGQTYTPNKIGRTRAMSRIISRWH